MEATHTPPEERKANLLLWIAVLAGPAMWTIQLLVVYALTPWVCQHVSENWLYVVSAVSIAVVVAVLGLAFYVWRKASANQPPAMPHTFVEYNCQPRVSFMAVAGLLSTALFCMVILAMSLPALVLSPC